MRLPDRLRRCRVVACTLCWINENGHKEMNISGLAPGPFTIIGVQWLSPRCFHALCWINEMGTRKRFLSFV